MVSRNDFLSVLLKNVRIFSVCTLRIRMLGARLRCDDTELSGDVEKSAGERALRVLPEDRATSFQARSRKQN